jgi:hypothetical protein
MAFGHQHTCGLKIETLGPDVAALTLAPLDGDEVAVAARDFLDHNGVGPTRQNTASKDAGSLTWPDIAVERPAGRDFPDDRQAYGRRRYVNGSNRIAVHGGKHRRRLLAQRCEICGEHSSAGIEKGRRFWGNGIRSANTSASASATDISATA